MSRFLKTLMLAVAGIVLLVVLSASALLLLLDPNDFRDDIAAKVEASTGRTLQIEGDLSVSLFPWLAVEMGRTRLGNAQGFGSEPFASFESARLSVRLMPLLLRREIAVGTAALDSMRLNLAVNAQGTGNWEDLGADGTEPATADDSAGQGLGGLDIASVEIRDAEIFYRDAAADAEYHLQNVTLTTGRIAFGDAFDLNSEFDFSAMPADLQGRLAVSARTTVANDMASVAFANLNVAGTVAGIAAEPAEVQLASERLRADLNASKLDPAVLTFAALGIEGSADITDLSWSDAVTAAAGITVQQFSPRDLLQQLGSEPLETADPAALSAVAFTASAAYGNSGIGLRNLNLRLDNTTLKGEVLVPPGSASQIRFDLTADTINLDRYMAPAVDGQDAGTSAAADDFEIPADMIRAVNAKGSLRLSEALLSDMRFTNVQLGLDLNGGKLRLNPLSADLFDGNYSGDVRVDASGATPKLSLNEKVTGVSLTPLAEAMFDRKNITGTINGNFVLNAQGKTLSVMRQNLNGTMSFELADGAWQGVDLWYQLRSARALYKREEAPEPRTPARTDFSSVLVNGTVKDGIFTNNDLVADMPFLRVTGNGTVNLVAGELDYALQARVLERPEFLRGASEAEIAEFTEALIPVRVRGKLTDPSVRPDIEAMFRKEVEDTLKKKGDELRDRLLQRLIPAEPPAEATEGEAEEAQPDPEEQLKNRLKDLFNQ